MTVLRAIEEAKEMLPGNVSHELMITWIKRLEGYIIRDVFEDNSSAIPSYLDADDILIVPDPYSEIYPLYLEANTAMKMGEYSKYNAIYELFNRALENYSKRYIRTRVK